MRRPGRPPSFAITLYTRRNVLERCVNRLKQWRGIATRYEKWAVNYRAAVVIAARSNRAVQLITIPHVAVKRRRKGVTP